MKLKLPLVLTLALLGSTSSIAQASNINSAYALCKAHISEVHQGARSTLKKIKNRKGHHQVKVKVRADGDRFTATCLVSRDGTITYSTNREADVVAKNI